MKIISTNFLFAPFAKFVALEKGRPTMHVNNNHAIDVPNILLLKSFHGTIIVEFDITVLSLNYICGSHHPHPFPYISACGTAKY